MRTARLAVILVMALSLMAPAIVLANSVTAYTSCNWTTGSVGQINQQYGTINYYASDWWVPKTGYYYTVWEDNQFGALAFNAGTAPHGSPFLGSDPNFRHWSWMFYGTFTVWGDASKNAVTQATALHTGTGLVVSTTSGVGHPYDAYAKCKNASGWVTVN
jgi:hypothetical protein